MRMRSMYASIGVYVCVYMCIFWPRFRGDFETIRQIFKSYQLPSQKTNDFPIQTHFVGSLKI